MTEIKLEEKKIDIGGTDFKIVNDEIEIILDERITPESFLQILEYLYTDKVSWDDTTDINFIKEIKIAANYLCLDRLEKICDSYIDTNSDVIIPESQWWENMKWAFENLRSGIYDLTDFTLICKDEDTVENVKCHSVILANACKYFHAMLLGDSDNEEKKKRQTVVEDCSKKQMESILKYIYTREFAVDTDDVVGVWVISNKFLLEDLQIECENLIMENITKENVLDIKKIAEMIQSEKILEMCEEIISQK